MLVNLLTLTTPVFLIFLSMKLLVDDNPYLGTIVLRKTASIPFNNLSHR